MEKIKKWFFKTCPKSGRIVGVNQKNVMLKIFFPLFGLAALVWFLIRVIPKPNRIDYPCQQVAAPIAFSFLAFIGSTLTGFTTWKKFRALWHSHRFCMGMGVLLTGILLTASLYVMSVDNMVLGQVIRKQIDNDTDMGEFIPIDKPNTPMGTARGIHPGRVAWAHDAKAAAWDGKHGLYSDADNNSQTRVEDMLEGVILALTNQTAIGDAWDELFRTFNQRKGKGTVGYQKGEKIAIKINLNDNGGSNIIDATPQSVCSLLYQLVEVVGVPQNCITVYDAQRRGISAVYTYVESLYPDVVYQNWGGFVPNVIHYSSEITDEGAMSLARAAYEADYMINMALLKRHSEPTKRWRDSAGQTGITATGKNQFGSVGKVPPLHYSIRDWSSFRGMGTYNCIVDLMAHERIGGNTLVYIVDGMYVNPKHNGKAFRFKRAPFNNGWTSSFFASNDQVAIESVVLDFIYSELPLPANSDNFLHEAANIGNPPSGILYKGRDQQSLGVHEHWNNPDDRLYSRNLGTGEGIELYRVPLKANRAAIETFYADRSVVVGKGEVVLYWNTSNSQKVLLNGKEVAGKGNLIVAVKRTSSFELLVEDADGKVVKQRLVVRNMDEVKDCPVRDAKLEGTFLINDQGQLALSGERSKERNVATWNIQVPKKGKYYLGATYTGTDPAPAFVYLNGEKVTENFGFLVTVGNQPRDYYFPIELEKGTSTLQFEIQGRRGNRIHRLFIVKERN